MFDVITIGSATVDVFAETDKKYFKNKTYSYPVGTKILVKDLQFSIGGGGTNAAVAFSRLGLKTAYLGKLGNDENYDLVISLLRKEKIDTSLVVRGKEKTGYSVILDAKGHDRTILTFKGANNKLRQENIKLSRIKTKWLYCTSMVGKSFTTLKEIVKYAKSRGTKIAFNPSSYQAKKGYKFLKAIIDHTDLIVMNKEEAYLLTKSKSRKIENVLRTISGYGPKIVIVTDGPRGLYAFYSNKFYMLKPDSIKIVETTGAGDAFASSFTAGMIKKNDIKFAMKLGLINAQSVITHYGAKEELFSYSKALKKIKEKKFRLAEY